jgi:coenzyme F420-reducing hydrogenase gamma subunit
MNDIATQLEIRRQISACETDLRRATEKAADAVRHISRATVLFHSPMEIDLDIVEGAVADIRDARQAYLAALRKKQELRAALGEE